MAKKKASNKQNNDLPPGVPVDQVQGKRAEIRERPSPVAETTDSPKGRVGKASKEVEEVELQESESTTITAGIATCSVPFLVLDGGYLKRRHDVYLSATQAENWRSLARGLEQQESRLSDGKMVSSVGDAIRWVGENVSGISVQ